MPTAAWQLTLVLVSAIPLKTWPDCTSEVQHIQSATEKVMLKCHDLEND
jgi:hypothetical protein